MPDKSPIIAAPAMSTASANRLSVNDRTAAARELGMSRSANSKTVAGSEASSIASTAKTRSLASAARTTPASDSARIVHRRPIRGLPPSQAASANKRARPSMTQMAVWPRRSSIKYRPPVVVPAWTAGGTAAIAWDVEDAVVCLPCACEFAKTAAPDPGTSTAPLTKRAKTIGFPRRQAARNQLSVSVTARANSFVTDSTTPSSVVKKCTSPSAARR